LRRHLKHRQTAIHRLTKGIPAAGFGTDLSDSDAECAKFKLASLIEPQKPLAGMKIKLRYKGLPNEPQLEVEFSEAFDRNK
jgi:hypothetical protein